MSHTPNFLEHADSGVVIVKPRRWIFGVGIIVILLLIFGGALVRPFQASVQAWRFAQAGKVALAAAQQAAEAQDLMGADRALVDASHDFEEASTQLRHLQSFRRISWIGRQISATETLLASGQETIAGAREVLAFAADMQTTLTAARSAQAGLAAGVNPALSFANFSEDEKRTLLARFSQDVPKLEAARAAIDRALVSFSTIPPSGLLAPLARAMRPLGEQLPRVRQDLDAATALAKILPALAGYPAPKRTLLLFLNNAELRPGGGFLGTVANVEIGNATIRSIDTSDAYLIDRPSEPFRHVAPPAPISRYLGITNWFMRDANWSPDFKSSAETVADFYERETNRGEPTHTTTTVIGFTPTFGAELLRITGPVMVDHQLFTVDNLSNLLEYQVEQGFVAHGIPFVARKQILVKLVDATVATLGALPASRWEDLLTVLDHGFREKQLMIYDRDPVLQHDLEVQGWAGRVDVGSGDFLKVVDANLGSLKSDPVVERHIAYQIVPDDHGFRATTSITYRHTGHFDWRTSRYRTYTRLYVPAGSELVSATGMMKDDKLKNPARDLGSVDVSTDPDVPSAAVFGAFVSIEPGEERTLSFTYRLPPSVTGTIAAGMYGLKVEKELGAAAHVLTLDLDFGKKVTNASPPSGEQIFGTHYRARTDVREDQKFEVKF